MESNKQIPTSYLYVETTRRLLERQNIIKWLNVNHFKLWLNILGCEHVDQKILAIEMAIEIKSLFFNRPYVFNFFLFVIKFMSSDYDQDVDKSIKKSWALK